MKRPSVLGAIFLALALLLAQHAGIRHTLSHIAGGADTKQQGKHHPAEKVCETCLVFAAIDGAASPAPPVAPIADREHDVHDYYTLTAARPAAAPYQSRAPPSLS